MLIHGPRQCGKTTLARRIGERAGYTYFTVVRGSPRDYVESHPRRPVLVVEVAQSRLRLARGRKAAVYARARITDYWIVNLVDRVFEVHREPARPGPARRGWGYGSVETLGADASITPLAAPTAVIRVADLLP